MNSMETQASQDLQQAMITSASKLTHELLTSLPPPVNHVENRLQFVLCQLLPHPLLAQFVLKASFVTRQIQSVFTSL